MVSHKLAVGGCEVLCPKGKKCFGALYTEFYLQKIVGNVVFPAEKNLKKKDKNCAP